MTEQDDDIVSVCNTIKSSICSKLSINDFSKSKVTPQIIDDCGPLKKKELAKHLLNLIASCDEYDHMTPGGDNISVRVNFDETAFENNIKEVIENNIKGIIPPSNYIDTPNINLNSISNKLDKLQSDVNKFCISVTSSPSSQNVNISLNNMTNSVQPTEFESTIKHSTKPFDDLQNEFLDSANANSLLEFLNVQKESGKMNQENGHSVLHYGKPYRYTGSAPQNPTSVIPQALDYTINKIIESFDGNYDINSVLINYYLGDSSSAIPEHSDNEGTINPESQIFTISLGYTRTVVFKDILDGSEHPLPV